MGHTHGHTTINGRNIFISVLLNGIITLAQFIGGIVANSLSLISDAIHNLSDTVAIALSYVAYRVGKRKPDKHRTFGYKRVEILAGLLNATVLMGISLFLVVEAIERFQNPEVIEGKLMFIVASIGLVANLVAVILLHKDASHNLNMRAAYLHLLSDTLSSVGVIVGSILIIKFQIYWIDTLLTLLISILIVKSAWGIIKDTINILMEAKPKDIAIEDIQSHVEAFGEVANIHHIHLWQISDKSVHLQFHIDIIKNLPLNQVDQIRNRIETSLSEKFDIHHITIQPEFNSCHNKMVIQEEPVK